MSSTIDRLAAKGKIGQIAAEMLNKLYERELDVSDIVAALDQALIYAAEIAAEKTDEGAFVHQGGDAIARKILTQRIEP